MYQWDSEGEDECVVVLREKEKKRKEEQRMCGWPKKEK